MLTADVKGSRIPSLRSLLVIKDGWDPVDVFSTGWWQEGHSATKALHQFPVTECTFLHSSSFTAIHFMSEKDIVGWY